MTYARAPMSLKDATTRAAAALGDQGLADAVGVSASRVRKCKNPMLRDHLGIDRALAADIACARAGGGLPHFAALAQALRAAGVLHEQFFEARLRRDVSLALEQARAALAALEPYARPVAARDAMRRKPA